MYIKVRKEGGFCPTWCVHYVYLSPCACVWAERGERGCWAQMEGGRGAAARRGSIGLRSRVGRGRKRWGCKANTATQGDSRRHAENNSCLLTHHQARGVASRPGSDWGWKGRRERANNARSVFAGTVWVTRGGPSSRGSHCCRLGLAGCSRLKKGKRGAAGACLMAHAPRCASAYGSRGVARARVPEPYVRAQRLHVA